MTSALPGGLPGALAGAAPVTPDRSTAQRWAREELAHRAYHQEENWWLKAAHWFLRQLDRAASATGLSAGQLLALVACLAIVVVVVVVLLRRQVRLRVATAAGPVGAVLGQSRLSGSEHRERAAAALAGGAYAESVQESMRAIARRLEERAILDPRPGRTADELAREATSTLGVLAGELRSAATVFDDVTYGGRAASRAQAEQVQGLDRAVEAARPLVRR